MAPRLAPSPSGMIPALFGLAGPQLGQDELAFFRDADPAGYILFGRNVQDREQLRALCDQLRAIHGRDQLLISIDQEGGRVARLRPPVWPAYLSGEVFDRAYATGPATAIQAARLQAHALGMDLAQAGITLDCWPCMDVRAAGAHDVIGDRALGAEPMQVAALGRAILEGLGQAGVVGCIKHLPGHGRAHADSHKELPRVDASAEALERDIAPFRTLCQQGAVRPLVGMTGHILFSAWDDEAPATLSRKVVQQVIRQGIGFDGLLITDDLDMAALSGTVAERAAGALAAGCDLALNCWGRMQDMVAIATACPTMPAGAQPRLNAALAAMAPVAFDGALQAELLATRDALLAAAGGGDAAAGRDPTVYGAP